MSTPQIAGPAVFGALAGTFLALVEATSSPGSERHGRDTDCIWAGSSVSVADINRVMSARLSGTDAEVEARVTEIHRRFDGIPYTWWLDPGATPPHLAEALRWIAPAARRDLVPAMVLDLAALPGQAGPGATRNEPLVETVFAASRAEMVAAGALAAEGFGASPEEAVPFGLLFEHTQTGPGATVRVALTRLAGRPAATALGCLHDDVLGVYNVATLPDVRRQGLALAATVAILRDGAARGARYAVLESTEEGLPLYRRLGFREVGRFDVLTIPGAPLA